MVNGAPADAGTGSRAAHLDRQGQVDAPTGDDGSPLRPTGDVVDDTGVPVGPEPTDWSKPDTLDRHG